MRHSKKEIIETLMALHASPKDPEVFERLRDVTTCSKVSKVDLSDLDGQGYLMEECAIYELALEGSCVKGCPLILLAGEGWERWAACPVSSIPDIRERWQNTLTEAEIMQKCIETVALMTSIK